MDAKKKAKFVERHSKERPRFSKGGLIKKIGDRKYFDSGGTVLGPTGYGTTQNAVNPNVGVMGTIGNALGLNNNFQAASGEITPGTNYEQLNQGYEQAQQGLGNQANIVSNLMPQVPTAVQNQNAVAQSELGMLNGTGPNPAMTQLNQTTGQNVANTTAEMAGQRGAGANVGLIAREAAQQGATTQQQAAGQAATLQAQQQVAAQQRLADLSNNQISQTGQAVVNQGNAQQNEQNILQSANTYANNASVGMQSNINNVNAQTAAGNQRMQGNIMGGVGSAISSVAPVIAGLFDEGGVVDGDHLKIAEMNTHSVKHAKKYADGGALGPNLGTSHFNSLQAPSGPSIEQTPGMQQGKDEDFSQDVKDLSKKKDPGSPNTEPMAPLDTSGPIAPGTELAGGSDAADLAEPLVMTAAHGGMMSQNYCPGPHKSHVANYLAGGGAVKAMVSPGEIYLSPEQVRKVIHEDADPAKIGRKFKGKAKVKGDSLKNDTIPEDLEDGGVVIDRKNIGTKEKRQLFVHKALARKKARA